MRGDETRVVEAFCKHLQNDGWDVQREVQFVDVMATRGRRPSTQRPRVERPRSAWMLTPSTGSSCAACRTKPRVPSLGVVVVPESAVPAALRVPEWIRTKLGVHIWAVADQGHVRLVWQPSSVPLINPGM